MSNDDSRQNNDLHESLSDQKVIGSESQAYIDPHLSELQNITSGGPPKKADLHSMPRAVRYFGYFFISIMVIMVFFALYFNLFAE